MESAVFPILSDYAAKLNIRLNVRPGRTVILIDCSSLFTLLVFRILKKKDKRKNKFKMYELPNFFFLVKGM